MSFVYIASPYTHPDPAVQEERFRKVQSFTAQQLSKSLWCYSPIVHCHELSKMHNLPTDFEFWTEYNKAMLEKATVLLVYTLPGWGLSRGVQAEIAFATRKGLTVVYCAEEVLP